jgi:hypothetical protein
MRDTAFEGLRARLARELELHPRVAQQGLASDDARVEKLARSLPGLVPFVGRFTSFLTVLDWDHRLPSRALLLRIFAYYNEGSAERGRRAFMDRKASIAARDRFPEFDVPDFDELPADEAYVMDLTPELEPAEIRLVSPWRRHIEPETAQAAIKVARGSPEFKKILKEAKNSGRDDGLGDLEAVSWTPPCESQHERWTVDVWFVLAFDGRVGSGRSLLVDVGSRRVVRSRELTLRA